MAVQLKLTFDVADTSSTIALESKAFFTVALVAAYIIFSFTYTTVKDKGRNKYLGRHRTVDIVCSEHSYY